MQLGQTRVMGIVTAQLVQPYRDRPKEGTLSIFTEFSPMADPSFEPGRPGELAVELGRIIDRGLRYFYYILKDLIEAELSQFFSSTPPPHFFAFSLNL